MYHINLNYDWNIISLPFNESINKADIIIRNNSVNYSWNDAVTQGIILEYLYDWNRRTNMKYTQPRDRKK